MFRRYTCVRQADQSDCGAAALATICLHYRRPLGLQQMRELAGTDRIGTNLLGLVQAAEKLSFSARAVKGDYAALPSAPLPAVAHVHTDEGLGHFVVLHKVTSKGVVVADPGRGVETLSRDEFSKKWTGYLLLLVPEQAIKSPDVSASAPVSPARRFCGLLGGHMPIVIEAVICAILMTLLGVATSYYVQHLVDSVLVRHEERLLHALGIGMVIIVIFRTLLGALRQYLLAHVGRKIDLALIAGFSRHLLRLPLKFFEMRRVGEILSRINDTAKVREAISGTTTTLLVDGVLVVALLAVLWIYDVQLALVATAFVPVLILTVIAHHPAAKRRSRDAMEQAGQLSAHLYEDVSGVETVKAFGAERRRGEEGEHRLVGFVQTVFSLQKLNLSMSSLGTFVTTIAGIVILWYGGCRVIDGALTIGQLMFFYSLLGYLLGPLERLASVNLKLQDALVAVDRLFQILDLEPEQVGGGKKAHFESLQREIQICDLSFKYGCRSNVLENLNLRIPAGKTVAIVGESGCGKSTLLKLLMGFYAPTEGRVLIDGVDLHDFELASLRSRIGVVSQDPFIFNGTIAENIALGRPDAPLGEVIEAARAAGLDEFIATLPERYQTVIGERGANLSGGQRQRLAIARALVCQPEILIFDEATSHLDTGTERAIQESLRTALASKTVILVAHRLSTIREADQIYVLHQGRVAEEGTHRSLVAKGGRYAALVNAQTDSHEPTAECRCHIPLPRDAQTAAA
ncbi:MAG TPA: peptidase domain-containing ABC transporter [Pirellulales bacterium]|jgi:ABC-type bacteriocin transporter|nr:peptidase domain-containing ABC transporter [Pirellulales bacterium]